MLGEGTIDDKLRKILNDKQELKETNNRLRSEIDDERQKIASLERKLAASTSKLHDNQEAAHDLHEIQSNPIQHGSTKIYFKLHFDFYFRLRTIYQRDQ